jgi:4-amino-4-deoxy-L-arabinose transferase-like glycosyltransferase
MRNNITRNAFLVLLVLVAINMFFGIGSIPLTDPDEPAYAETAREMIAFHDYVSPRIFNEYWYDKPPMYYWLVAGAYQVFGINEFAARFPAALMGLLSVLAVYFSATKLFNERAGFWSGIVLGTCINMFYMGKAGVTDTTLLFFMTAALLSFLHEQYWAMYICMGLATLTKGPIGIVFPGAIIFLTLLCWGDLRRLLKMHIIPGIILCMVIVTPWYYHMYQLHGMEFINTFLGFHNLTRFTTPEHPTRVLWYYYLPVMVLGIFPWTGILIQSIKSTITDSRSSDLRNLIFMQVWWIFVLVFFTISKTKLVSYILPMFPALAIMIGWNIDRMMRENGGRYVSWAIGSGLMFLIMGIGWIVGGRYVPELVFGGYVLGSITILLGIGIVVALLVYRDGSLGAWLHVATGLITMFIAMAFLLPTVQDDFSVRTIARAFTEKNLQNEVVYVDKFIRPGFMFYTHIPGIEVTTAIDKSIETIKNDSRPKYAVMRRSLYNRAKEDMNATNWKAIAETKEICIYKSN